MSRREIVGRGVVASAAAGIQALRSSLDGASARTVSVKGAPLQGGASIDRPPLAQESNTDLNQVFLLEHRADGLHLPDIAGAVDVRKASPPIISNVQQDYSQTLQQLIDEASAIWESGDGPSRIVLPNGFITLSSTVRLRDGIELKGQGSQLGKGTRFLWQGPPDVPVFDSSPDNYLSSCRVEDIGIEPQTALGYPPPTGQGHGMVLYTPTNTCSFRRISIARLTGNAIDIRRQSRNPDDRTGAGNCLFEQIFTITNGGFGVRAEGYHQVHFLMPDSNGNRLGDFHLLKGSGNQSAVLISSLWAESGGESPSAAQRILLEDLDGGQVTFVSPQFSGPMSLECVIRIIGTTGAAVNLIGASQFGAGNWLIDAVRNLVVTASHRINLIGEELDASALTLSGPSFSPGLPATAAYPRQRRFEFKVRSGRLDLRVKQDEGEEDTILLSADPGSSTMVLGAHLVPDRDVERDVGASEGFRFRDLHLARDIRIGGSMGIAGSVPASISQNIVRKLEIFDVDGVSLGFIPIYDQID